MNKYILFLGILFILIGFSLIILYSLKQSNIKYSGIILIGPIPIIFTNSIDLSIILLIIIIIIVIIFLFYKIII
ncbi:hypothetical protein MJ1_0742 [Nanobdella aerobiophila]|uniref:DUF131 domain-containing protein n=1 Tax=Nanobdella aerobiophila TaxID=2586965 RepID=A0A915WT56_9ARCH|nr:hypothetical protein MJ1_0742 [Nanobdella aerobiophila]